MFCFCFGLFWIVFLARLEIHSPKTHVCYSVRCGATEHVLHKKYIVHTHTHTHTRAHTHTCVHTRVGPWYQRQCGASEHAVIMQSISNARLFWTLYFAYGTLELGLWVVMSPFVGSSVLAFCWHFFCVYIACLQRTLHGVCEHGVWLHAP